MHPIIGKAYCRLFGRHAWSRAGFGIWNHGESTQVMTYMKRCKRCDATIAVKPRKRKEAQS